MATAKQISDVQRTWEGVRGQGAAAVSECLIKLFKDFPSAQAKFSTFGTVPVGSLAGNAAFNAQCKVVAERFDAMIKSMGDAATFKGHIDYMGHSHKPRNIDRSLFDTFARHLTDLLSSKGVAAADVESWKGALNAMITAIYSV